MKWWDVWRRREDDDADNEDDGDNPLCDREAEVDGDGVKPMTVPEPRDKEAMPSPKASRVST